MNNNKFFDMDLDEPIVQEGSVKDPLMFYDDDEVVQEADENIEVDTTETVEEPAVEEPSTDNADSSADAESEIAKYDKEYVDRISKYQFKDELEELEIAIGAKLPKDFAEGVSMFDDNNFSGAQLKIDDKVAFVVNEMWPLNRITTARKQDNQHIDNEKLFAIGDDGFGNFIVMNSTDWTYHIWYHDSKKTVMIAKAFDEVGVDPSYNISTEDTLLYKLGYKFPEEADKTDEPPHEGEDVVESIEGVDEVTTEEEPDGSTEVTEDIETTEEPAVEEEPAVDASAEEETPVEDEPTLESYVQEDGEISDEQTVGEAIEAENETADTGSTTTSDDFDFDFDLDAPTSTEDALEGSTTPEGDDLKDFGTDTSDVQNDYDPKEIEILNKLIAAEAEAINDYFDASKDSHDSNARRLYSDIGREERFHMEQLMYQKSTFTGEKYEPRDPEVKKEYEELLQLGMDDNTAMQTAIDKRSMETTNSIDEMDFEILEYAANNTVTMLHQAEIILEASMYAYYHRADNTAKQYGIILEAYFQEEVMNTAKAPKELKGTPNPFALLLKGFRAAVSALASLTANIRESSERSRINRHARMEWIKKNGITGLFKSGVHFYFYNDTDSAFNMVIPVQYVDLLYRLSIDIGKKCGVTVTQQGYRGTIKNPIKYNSIEDGINKIRSLNMTKTKVIVTDQNKDALLNEFFGYSDKKINVKVWNEEANRAIYESNNVYNKLMCFAVITKQYSMITDQILEVMKGLQGNMNSIYYKDRNAYNKYVGYMETIVKTYIKISNAAASDLTEMLYLDKKTGVKDLTDSRDAGNKLPEGAEDRRTSGALGNNRANKQYAKTKK